MREICKPMLELTQLRQAINHQETRPPLVALMDIAGALTISKTATNGSTERVALKGLQVEHDYQRPPDREKLAAMVAHLQAGGTLPPVRVNRRPDGSLWITDGQHRAAARAIHGETHTLAVVTDLPSQQEPAETNLVTKIADDRDSETVAALVGAGAVRDGKRLVLDLGAAGLVSYVPCGEWVGKVERGELRVVAGDAWGVACRLGLDFEVPKAGGHW